MIKDKYVCLIQVRFLNNICVKIQNNALHFCDYYPFVLSKICTKKGCKKSLKIAFNF